MAPHSKASSGLPGNRSPHGPGISPARGHPGTGRPTAQAYSRTGPPGNRSARLETRPRAVRGLSVSAWRSPACLSLASRRRWSLLPPRDCRARRAPPAARAGLAPRARADLRVLESRLFKLGFVLAMVGLGIYAVADQWTDFTGLDRLGVVAAVEALAWCWSGSSRRCRSGARCRPCRRARACRQAARPRGSSSSASSASTCRARSGRCSRRWSWAARVEGAAAALGDHRDALDDDRHLRLLATFVGLPFLSAARRRSTGGRSCSSRCCSSACTRGCSTR